MSGTERTYLAIPYAERREAFRAAGKLPDGSNALGFDEKVSSWYANAGTDLQKLKRWIPRHLDGAKSTTDPEAEFRSTLEEAGFVLTDNPEMDGKWHRVSTLEDKPGQKSGAYKAYLDGVPAGVYQDHRHDDKPIKWISQGTTIAPEQQIHNRALSAQRKIQRDAERRRQFAHNARRSTQLYALLPDAKDSQQYCDRKGVKAFPGVKVDKQNRLVIPLQNENFEIRSLQRISGNGFKSLKKNGEKQGNFFVVGGVLQNGQPLLYAEGYSTAASISEATGRGVVMAVDAYNLPRVAEKLSQKYPGSSHVFFADDDRDNKKNTGLIKAIEAAKLTQGAFVVPKFNAAELANELTDFNDLHRSRGLAEVKLQAEAAISQIDKATTMTDDKDKPTPVVTEQFERDIDSGLTPNQAAQERPVLQPNFTHNGQPATLDLNRFTNQAQDSTQDNNAPEAAEPVRSMPQPNFTHNGQPATLDLNRFTSQAQDSAQDNNAPEADEPVRPVLQPNFTHNGQPATLDLNRFTSQAQDAAQDNTVEPFIEQQKAESADADVKAWLAARKASPANEMPDAEGSASTSGKTALASDAEPERSRKPKPQLDNDIFENTTFKPVIPDKVAKSYIEVEGKYYFQNRPDSLAFIDKGAKLQTKLNTGQVAASMVDIAEARGWTELQVKGTPEFRKEAWLEAASRGMEVKGYTPKEEDLARLKQLVSKRPSNEIEGREQADTYVSQSTGQPSEKNNQQAEKAAVPEPVNKLAGTLIDHGKAPYENQSSNKSSYFVTLENEDGKQSTTWGVDLERAVKESNAEPGQKIELENQGRKPVQIEKAVTDAQGKVVDKEVINTYRNTWTVKAEAILDKERPAREILKEHPDLINEIAQVKLAEKFSKSLPAVDQERFMDQVRNRVATNVSNGDRAPEMKVREERSIQKNKENDNER